MTPREHALRVALLSALLDEVKAAHAQARAEAQEAFAPIRRDGTTQQLVLLPDGERVGLISIRDGSDSVEFGETELLAWVSEHLPHEVVDVVAPHAWNSVAVVELVRQHFPALVRREVRPSCRERLIEEMRASGGKVADTATGEVTELGKVTRNDPTGAFSYRPSKGAPARLAAEWRAGHLDSIAGPLARAVTSGGGSNAA